MVGDTSLTTDSLLTLYAVAYDANGNYLGEAGADWTITGSIGDFITTNPNDSIIFDPTTVGSGTIRAADTSNALVNSTTGLIRVSAGGTTYLVIRNAPGGTGSVVADDTLMVGASLTLYSAGYDADSNFVADVGVDWDSTGTLTGLIPPITSVSQLILSPDVPGAGQVFTTNGSGWVNDSTGTLVVQSGTATSIVLRTQPNNGGIPLDTLTRAAGDSISLWAAFYDYLGNYLGDQPVSWSTQGAIIGYFADSTVVDSNKFYFTTVNAAIIHIQSGLLSDNSGLIQVTPGTAYSALILAGNDQTGEANTILQTGLEVLVNDFFSNPVPGATVNWSTPSDGSLSPDGPTTDELGQSLAWWQLKSTLGPDTAYAEVPGIDTLLFRASVVPQSADSIRLFAGDNQTDTVAQTVSDLVVLVFDSLKNPVSDVRINFSVDSLPSGATGYGVSPTFVNTDSNGFASTSFTLGNKIGTYRIRAFNGALRGEPVMFRIHGTADAADTILVYAGNQQTGIVGDTLSLPIQARVVDQYINPVSGILVDWTPTADGDTSVISNISNSTGLVSTNWILRTPAGPDTLLASAAGLGTALFTATANHDVANTIIAYDGNNTTTIAGGNRTILAQALDQYGNPASNTIVNFLPVSRVLSANVVTNGTGLAQTVYNTPTSEDSSLAQAFITSLTDTANFNIYAVRYFSNTLRSKSCGCR